MLSKEKKIELYRKLLTPRYIEDRMLLLLRQGKISKWFSGIGQEAISVGSTYALNENDMIFPMHRNLGVFTTRKVDKYKLFCQLFGKANGFTKGRDRTFHFGDMDNNIVGMISHLAAMLPVACGVALSYKLENKSNIAVAFIGDGATSEGDFHEALNIAAVWKLPIIFLIENNGYGLSTPTSEQYKCEKLSDKALGYGIEGKTIDGNNVLEVYSEIASARKRILKGGGPVLIEALTFRIRGHEEASGVKYVPKTLIQKWKKNDPINNYQNYLLENKLIDKKQINNVLVEVKDKYDSIIYKALDEDVPKSIENKELNDVYCNNGFNFIEPSYNDLVKKRFVDAISDALREKLFVDKSVLIMGQDIAEYGGVFKVTEGFAKEFGTDRVRNTPIIESGIIGTAMGLAIKGYKPIVEMQFADFVSVGFNQIVNNLAKTYYRWGQPVNVTLRMPTGGGIGAGPFHSQSTESWFFHVPGLKIIYPSNPFDAKGLLHSSIDDQNPVMFFEHKALYRSITEEIPNTQYNIEIGKGRIVHEGNNITVVTYGMGVKWMTDYLDKYHEYKHKIEIIDLRTLLPWDKDIIISSIEKTNKLLIINEDNITGSISGEISAYIVEHYFDLLDAPIMRLGSIDTPIPFSSRIEEKVFFPVTKIDDKIKKLLSY